MPGKSDQRPEELVVPRPRKIRFRLGVILSSAWLILWIVISIALIDIAIEQFRHDKNYLTLGSWLAGILVGYFLFVLIQVRARRKQAEADRAQSSG